MASRGRHAKANDLAWQRPINDRDGLAMFGGAKRGICGQAIREASLRQVERFARLRNRQGLAFSIVGCGGLATAEDVRRYLNAGADGVRLATAAMVDPAVALRIRQDTGPEADRKS